MRYFTIIFDEAMGQDGSFKVTSKGYLPTKLVKQANDYCLSLPLLSLALILALMIMLAPRKTDIQPLLKHTFQFSIK
ncbi:hypothetical protein HQQ94_00225 [Shewanella sp. VB17]|uniref:hypothetical protein n=1 Tax=Shewanella sp. VB17 TaxID=2739432 RepID=UPI001566DEFD|nr:hypothetical protein [Shewanella sp. VB17]NRD71700.1 hypothetical protein [Shewanella sp. VB17]